MSLSKLIFNPEIRKEKIRGMDEAAGSWQSAVGSPQ
jgi:hypothetical protein